jgi:hypothetical protein
VSRRFFGGTSVAFRAYDSKVPVLDLNNFQQLQKWFFSTRDPLPQAVGRMPTERA